jgi:hypothetical protein
MATFVFARIFRRVRFSIRWDLQKQMPVRAARRSLSLQYKRLAARCGCHGKRRRIFQKNISW